MDYCFGSYCEPCVLRHKTQLVASWLYLTIIDLTADSTSDVIGNLFYAFLLDLRQRIISCQDFKVCLQLKGNAILCC